MNAWSLHAPRDQPEKESKREKKRKKKNTGWPSFFEKGPLFLFSKGSFIPLLVDRGKWKMQSHTESAQTLHLFCLYWNKEFFFAYLSHKQCCVHYLLALEACEHFMTLLIKAAQPENLFSLEMFFLYISNLCEPQKMLNRVTFLREQRCSELQQRKNHLAQKSDVVNLKATLVFLTFQLC